MLREWWHSLFAREEDVGKVQILVKLDKDYASSVMPWMSKLFMKDTPSDLFKLALGVLAFHGAIMEKGHRLIEVDSQNQRVGYVAFPETSGPFRRSDSLTTPNDLSTN